MTPSREEIARIIDPQAFKGPIPNVKGRRAFDEAPARQERALAKADLIARRFAS